MWTSWPGTRHHLVTAPGAGTVTVGSRIVGSQYATFLRFVAVGATGSAAYGLLFVVISATTESSHLAVNLMATVGSTVLSSELHRRFTFHASGRRSVSHGQSAGVGMAALGLVVSSFVLTGWNMVNPGAGDLATLLVVYTSTGLMGLVNFVTQRSVLAHSGPAQAPGPEVADWVGLPGTRPTTG